MISESLTKKINEQIGKELYASYLYFSMSCDCMARSLIGFGSWLRAQAAEELEHAKKFIEHLESRGAKVELSAVAKPPSEFESVQAIFTAALEHERGVTRSINDIYRVAKDDNDFAAQAFLDWFVTEQIEEEANASLIVDKLKMIGGSAGSLLYLDKEMGKRAEKA